MRVVKTIKHLRQILDEARRKGQKIGFVPTMGYFHEGHLSLMRQAQKECDVCVVSIYVNPKQFGPQEDLSRYPRDIKRDATMVKKENVDILFIPSDNVIYPNCYLTYIDVEKISDWLCGKYRPGHFKGVATIVAKLLNMVQSGCHVSGAKRRAAGGGAEDHGRGFEFSCQYPCGADSPRKRRTGHQFAQCLFVTQSSAPKLLFYTGPLRSAVIRIRAGERRASQITGMIRRIIKQYSDGKIQYVACVDADTLEPLKMLKGKVLIALSVTFGKTRLIDNVIVSIKKSRKI